jgi:predicted SAM-dependent methyltransferase
LVPEGPPARLHLGCGPITPAGWVNLDGSWNFWLSGRPRLRRMLEALTLIPVMPSYRKGVPGAVVHDIRRPLPFEAASFDAVYASHLIEHLYHSEARALLAECRRVLRPSGVLRLVVPDLRSLVQAYVAEAESADPARRANAAHRLNQSLLLREERPRRGHPLHRLYSAYTDFHSHKWMYDRDSLSELLRAAGFVEVGVRAFRDSRIAGVEQVEMPERVLDGAGVCVEGVRPAAP